MAVDTFRDRVSAAISHRASDIPEAGRVIVVDPRSRERQKLSSCPFLSSKMGFVRFRQRKSLSERNRQFSSSDGFGHLD
jgi:hypothetical protein